jgi:hypothetical protein
MKVPAVITSKVCTAGLPPTIAPFFLVDTIALPGPVFFPVVEAFWEAVAIIAPTVRSFRQINILFGAQNFTIHLSSGSLTYLKDPEVINACFNDMIFIDCERLLAEEHNVRVVCILEELVHILYNVIDETITAKIVSLLFPKIKEVSEKYSNGNE